MPMQIQKRSKEIRIGASKFFKVFCFRSQKNRNFYLNWKFGHTKSFKTSTQCVCSAVIFLCWWVNFCSNKTACNGKNVYSPPGKSTFEGNVAKKNRNIFKILSRRKHFLHLLEKKVVIKKVHKNTKKTRKHDEHQYRTLWYESTQNKNYRDKKFLFYKISCCHVGKTKKRNPRFSS